MGCYYCLYSQECDGYLYCTKKQCKLNSYIQCEGFSLN